jgi:hypothetical protein
MFKGKDKAFSTSNDWWGPHSPEGDFSNHPTEATRIREHLTHAEAAKYYPNGFPKDWKDSPKYLSTEAREEATQAKSAESMVEKLTKGKNTHSSQNLEKNKSHDIDSYMEAISEELPATPRLQHVLPVPVPVPHERWPTILPCTPTHNPRKSWVVHKPAPPGGEKGSPLRKSWVLPDSGDSSEESQEA